MTELLTAAQMRAIEQVAMDSGSATGLALMERAGAGVVEAILAQWPDLAKAPHEAVILCGPGNNGGDGFVVARLLQARGWRVEAWLAGDPDRLPPDAKANHDRWASANPVRTLPHAGASRLSDDADAGGLRLYDGRDVALVVDALFGTGLTRGIDPVTAEYSLDVLADRSAGAEGGPMAGRKVVAIDIPSGLCADSGRVIGASVAPADLTVTFHAPKRGHMLATGPALCGALRVVDIGLTAAHTRRAFAHTYITPAHRETHAVLFDAREPTGEADAFPIEALVAKTPRGPFSPTRVDHHKYDHGHALVLSGGPGKGGAARLAARGALRVGAGLVTVGCPPEALPETAARLDAIMCRPLPGADALSEVLTDARLNALCLGPGLGVGAETRALVWAALKARRATVLDADALTSFADDPPALFESLTGDCVLTPHMGEFARLFPDLAERLSAPATAGPATSRIDVVAEAAEIAGCTVLLKGADTVIADAGGRVTVHSAHYDRAAPWLATAGAGDVLAGIIAGLLARGCPATRAACLAAWLHVEAARAFGPGLIAEDLPERLPRVLGALSEAP